MISEKKLSDYLAVVKGAHRDPFSILGMHIEDAAESKVIVVRAFRPDAVKVSVIEKSTDKEFPMKLLDDNGLFELLMPQRQETFDYLLKIENEEGQSIKLVDPYSFLPVITEFDRHLFLKGVNYRAYEKMGAHPLTIKGVKGTYFSLWAPNALRVSVVGDFNYWDGSIHCMRMLGDSGIWELFIPGVDQGALYKFEIETPQHHTVQKADPFGTFMQLPPETASVVYDLDGYNWNDEKWMIERTKKNHLEEPMCIYEVHLGSWLRDDNNEMLNYRDIAVKLADYCQQMGYTHVELLPVSEHPFYGSWGYQVVGYYAPSSRYGTPHDFMAFVDHLHASGISVILDWVPAHFPKDAHGLGYFDGTPLFEHADPRKGEQLDWGTLVYNYGRAEVQNFLISNLIYWCEKFHIDGFRMDAVASMLYLDYSKPDGGWVPNEYGGRENLEAVEFLKHANSIVHQEYPGVLMIAEESTSWPGVSRPLHLGGLGFDLKWNMGWMNDTLKFFSADPIYRKYEINKLTFGIYYVWSENFVNVLSHDEVVHGKQSLLNKMPGDTWQRFANLRLLLGFMYSHPGKKLIFMGGDFGQQIEWNHDQGLDWHLLQHPLHFGLNHYSKDLLQLYRRNPCMYKMDFDHNGFQWIDFHDNENTIISYMRKTKNPADTLIFVFNFTPVSRQNYKVGVPFKGRYDEVLNSDSEYYGGSNVGNPGTIFAEEVWTQEQPHRINLNLPPLGMVVMKPLDAPKMMEVGADKKLLQVFTMPADIKTPKPPKSSTKKRNSKTSKKTKSSSAKKDERN